MKNFFFGVLSLVLLIGCDGPGDSGGLPPTTPGVLDGENFVSVGGSTGSLPPDGTCGVPAIALGGFTPPKVLKYVVSQISILWCGAAGPTNGSFFNIDFSHPPFEGLTCQELAADTPAAVSALGGPCCVMYIAGSGGYVQTTGLYCGSMGAGSGFSTDTFKVLCSIGGAFMGWACG